MPFIAMRRRRAKRASDELEGLPLALGRRRAGQAVYVLSGPLAWVERGARLAVLRVHETNRRARRFQGRTVTVELGGARLHGPDPDADGRRTVADLVPGEHVEVRVALPRRLAAVPELVSARAVVSRDRA